MSSDRARYDSGMLIVASRRRKLKQPTGFDRLDAPQDQVPPSFRATPRVLAILAALAFHRYLSATQLARLDGGSARVVRHLLKLLFRHGLVSRPKHQHVFLSSFFDQGNFALVYTITRKGMRLLAEHGLPVDPRQDWTTRNSGSSPLFLAHALEVSQTMLDLRLATLPPSPLKLIEHFDLLPSFPAGTRALDHPFRLSVNISQHHKPLTFTVIPDRIFSIAADQQRWNFALEIDRGTESLSTRSKKITAKATWRKKVAGYYHAWKQRKHVELWAFSGFFRVLTITPSETRLANMIDIQREVTNDTASGLFLYSTPARIAQHGILGLAWRTSKDDALTLVRT